MKKDRDTTRLKELKWQPSEDKGCLFCSQPSHERKYKSIRDLVLRGSEIRKWAGNAFTQKSIITHWIQMSLEGYHQWLCGITAYILKNKIGDEASFNLLSDREGILSELAPDKIEDWDYNEKLSEKIKNAIEHKIELLEKLDKRNEKSIDSLFTFELTENGTLSRKDAVKGDRPYIMEKGSMRYKVLKELSSASTKNDKYYPTEELASCLGFKTFQIRRTCGEIRKQISKHFTGIKNKEFIDSIAKSGYRINPKARIMQLS